MLLSLKTALLGIIQGITEFLPISSTGHMILVDEFMQIDSVFKESFFVIVQLGSILAVLVYFHRKLLPVAALRDRELRCQTFFLWLKTAVGVIPAIVVGGLWGSWIKSQLYDSAIGVGIALFLGGIALLAIESRRLQVKVESIDALSNGRADWLHPVPGDDSGRIAFGVDYFRVVVAGDIAQRGRRVLVFAVDTDHVCSIGLQHTEGRGVADG
jgi:undecaprenyl-diphosphatase